MKNESKKTIKCPQCGRLTSYSSENKFRPFCSERCRTIDLGQWADESYRIPVEQSAVTSEWDLPEDDKENYQ
jgi:hypothetical protein